MAEIVVMPKAGLTMEEGTIVAWLVGLGEEVAPGQAVCEVETEKITTEVEAHEGGVLLRRLEEGVRVPVGEPIGILGAADEDVSHLALWGEVETAPEPAARQVAEAPSAPPRGDRVASTPVARRLADSLGVDLGTLTGTGPGGRITREDVETAAKSKTVDVEQATKMRKAIAASMTLSAAIPQYSLERDVDVTDLEQSLADVATTVTEAERPTVADAIVAATARSLRDHPDFLRSWENEGYRIYSNANVGVAVAVEGGLVVPVIPDADQQTVTGLAGRRRSMQEKVTSGTGLSREEAGGGVFTVSNLGALGVDRFRALVNPPESGILAVGRVTGKEGRRIVTLTLSADHRVTDGATGARLLESIADALSTEHGIAELLGTD
jgi:pyruvate dehydrogenase E2 component (dihydrolipoamide acetyltransferase)